MPVSSHGRCSAVAKTWSLLTGRPGFEACLTFTSLVLWLGHVTSLSLVFLIYKNGINNTNIGRFLWRSERRYAKHLAWCLGHRRHTKGSYHFIIIRHPMKMGKTLPYLKVVERRVGDRHIQRQFEVKHATTRVQQNFRSIIKKYESKEPLLQGGNSNLGQSSWEEGQVQRQSWHQGLLGHSKRGGSWGSALGTGRGDGRWWRYPVSRRWTTKGLTGWAKFGFYPVVEIRKLLKDF